jgi:TPR repeat protein
MEDPVPDADAGRLWAQYEVAVRVANADGVRDTPDYAYAATWCRRAAERGHAGAQAMLGVMSHRGQGVPRDDVEALKWLTLAVRQQPPERDAYALWRDEVARQMTADQIADAGKRAAAWSSK